VVSYTNCNNISATGTAKVLPIRHDEYIMNVDNPFAKPYEKLVWRVDYGATGAKKHELITAAGQSVSVYNLRYLRKPAVININNGVDCDLHESIHEEIVEMAVMMAISSIPKVNESV